MLLAANEMRDVGGELGRESAAIAFDPLAHFFMGAGEAEVACDGYGEVFKWVFHFWVVVG